MADAAHEPHAPVTIRRADYTPPAWLVPEIALHFDLGAGATTVRSELKVVRNPEAERTGNIRLNGDEIEPKSVLCNGAPCESWTMDGNDLLVSIDGEEALISITTELAPDTNSKLMGLYASNGMLCTQCEAEGFRRITFFPDRPDVLSTYTVRMEGDATTFPVLLSNGNKTDEGELEGGRHWAEWHDPWPKPSYLFALVAGDLVARSDSFTTMNGRKVELNVYVRDGDLDRTEHAMESLKRSMRWDEVNYGRAYDLDRYMIVAVSQFNMGAMENKGLNIFNTACVLSSPETTTDARSFSVKSIIAHEYFHNWTGNRITCRDWFQLCLKEGLTVYRDQSFSADQQSSAVQRIDDVATLRAHQFSEDAGPLAHPVRPESFVEINNFYTTTVYEKGAEIVRMIANTLGPKDFRKGTDEYFRRYDGQAVTVEDFLSALSITDSKIEDFIDWYRQPGTPVVSGHQSYDSDSQTLTITLKQQTRHVPGFDAPKPLPIPVATALFDKDSGAIIDERMLMLDQAEQTFSFDNIMQEPVVSLLRDFSAPVQLNYDYQDEDLAFLLEHETNGFNQWQVTQMLVNRILLTIQDNKKSSPDIYLQSLAKTLPKLAVTDAMLAARLLDIPSVQELASAIHQDYDPKVVKQQRNGLYKQVAQTLKNEWTALYNQLPLQPYSDTPEALGKRALRNVVLDMALTAEVAGAKEWAQQQYENASCMTERFGALKAMVNHRVAGADKCLADFYQRFYDNDLVIDLWFSVQASSAHVTTQDIKALLVHDDFDWNTPNRIRSVISASTSQPTVLWTAEGLSLFTGVIKTLDGTNPVLASRLLQVLARWYTLAEPTRQMAQDELVALQQQVSSKNVIETLDSVLSAAEASA
ncbi:aminopeptidase N [uncultured Psychrobacter sp.]|uniref:aminopeptidase N n=1 Tax=uncultured Psychrobacter sp. TaxID=259303 RepID=UPI00261B8A8F|nr:aminopeptidase N [uncultured Psychrobacter sp.]